MWSRLANFVKTACEHLSQDNSFANQPETENNLEEISTNVLSGVALVSYLTGFFFQSILLVKKMILQKVF